jgi:arylsulfatase
VRVGDWKLVARHAEPWELYNLAKDRTEAMDLTAMHPDKVQALSARYDAWAKRANVEPWPVLPE